MAEVFCTFNDSKQSSQTRAIIKPTQQSQLKWTPQDWIYNLAKHKHAAIPISHTTAQYIPGNEVRIRNNDVFQVFQGIPDDSSSGKIKNTEIAWTHMGFIRRRDTPWINLKSSTQTPRRTNTFCVMGNGHIRQYILSEKALFL